MAATPSSRARRDGRPDSEHAARQREIRDKARDIFLRHGYRKTTTEDIGKACGLGKAALYHYFSSKEEIFTEVVRAEGEKLMSQVRAAVAASDDPKVQLVAMLRTSFNQVSRIAAELVENKGIAELMVTLPGVAELHQRFIEDQVEILRQIIEDGARRGVFKKLTSPSIPLVIISGLRGITMQLLETPNPPPIGDAIDALLDLLLDGMCQ